MCKRSDTFSQAKGRFNRLFHRVIGFYHRSERRPMKLNHKHDPKKSDVLTSKAISSIFI